MAPFFARGGAALPHRDAAVESRLAELESSNLALHQKLDRSLHEVDRATESVHVMESRLAQALATNRDSVAYAQQLEAELRLRRGEAPTLDRSAAPEALAFGPVASAPEGDISWYVGAASDAPELPDATPAPTVVTRFVEVESADSRRVRARLARKTWDEVVQRAVIGECKGRSASRFDACAAEVEGRLTPFQTKASQCMAGNFGGTFYLEDGNRLSPPTNGVTLDRGIVVFCDPNLKDGGLDAEG